MFLILFSFLQIEYKDRDISKAKNITVPKEILEGSTFPVDYNEIKDSEYVRFIGNKVTFLINGPLEREIGIEVVGDAFLAFAPLNLDPNVVTNYFFAFLVSKSTVTWQSSSLSIKFGNYILLQSKSWFDLWNKGGNFNVVFNQKTYCDLIFNEPILAIFYQEGPGLYLFREKGDFYYMINADQIKYKIIITVKSNLIYNPNRFSLQKKLYFPDIHFAEGGEISFIAEWLTVDKPEEIEIKITAGKKIRACYETVDSFYPKQIIIEGDIEYVYGIYKGYYYIDENQGNKPLPDDHMNIYKIYFAPTVPITEKIKKITPIGGKAFVELLAFNNPSQYLYFMNADWSESDICFRGRNGKSYVRLENCTFKKIIIDSVNIELRSSVNAEEIVIRSNAELILFGNIYINVKRIVVEGNILALGSTLTITERLQCNWNALRNILSSLSYDCAFKLEVKDNVIPDSCSWTKKSLNVVVNADKLHPIKINYRHLSDSASVSTSNSINLFQTKFILDPECNLQNKDFLFEFSSSDDIKTVLLLDKGWYECRDVGFNVLINSKNSFYLKTVEDFDPYKTKVRMTNEEWINDTAGKYCVISSNNQLSHCQREEETILLNHGNVVDYKFVGKKYLRINVVEPEVTFLTSCFTNFVYTTIIGKNNSIVLDNILSDNHDMIDNELIVNGVQKITLRSRDLPFSLRCIDLYDVKDSVIECPHGFDIKTKIKCSPIVLEKILPMCLKNTSITAELLLDGFNINNLVIYDFRAILKGVNNEIALDLSKISTLNLFVEKMFITKENSLLVDIQLPKHAMFYGTINVYSSSVDNYITFPSYKGYENYLKGSKPCNFYSSAENSTWHIESKSASLPTTIFNFTDDTNKHFDVVTKNKKAYLCLFRTEKGESNCRKTQDKFNYVKDKEQINNALKESYYTTITLYDSEKGNELDLSNSTTDGFLFIFSKEKGFVLLPSKGFNKLKLTNINFAFKDNKCDIDYLELLGTSEIAEKTEMNIKEYYCDEKTFFIGSKVNLTAPVDNLYFVVPKSAQIIFKNNEIVCSRFVFNQKIAENLVLVFPKSLSFSNPIDIDYSGDNNVCIEYLPKFCFRFNNDVNILFREGWEGKTLSVKNNEKIRIKISNIFKTNVVSKYNGVPNSVFEFTNLQINRQKIIAFCLVPSDDYATPNSCKKVVFHSKDEVLSKELVAPQDDDSEMVSVEYLISGTTKEKYPVFPADVFNFANVTLTGDDNIQYITIPISSLHSLSLVNINLTITTSNPYFEHLNIDYISGISFTDDNSVIDMSELNVYNIKTFKSLIPRMSIKSKRHLNLYLNDELITTCTISCDNISLTIYSNNVKEKTAFEINKFTSVNFYLPKGKLFIDYTGEQKEHHFVYMPTFIFVDGDDHPNVLISDRWNHKGLTTDKKGYFIDEKRQSIDIESEFSDFPWNLFAFDEGSTLVVRKQGSYCIYNSTVKNQWKNCNKESTLITHDKSDLIYTPEILTPNDFGEIVIQSMIDIRIDKVFFNFFLQLESGINNKMIKINVEGDSKVNGNGNIEMKDVELNIKGTESISLSVLSLTSSKITNSENLVLKPKEIKMELDDYFNNNMKFIGNNVVKSYINFNILDDVFIISNDKVEVKQSNGKSFILEKKITGKASFVLFSSKETKKLLIKAESQSFDAVDDLIVYVYNKFDIFFDNSVYSAETKVKGNIRILGSISLLTFRSNIVGNQPLFQIPLESVTKFGPERTPMLTPCATATPIPLRTPSATIDEYKAYIDYMERVKHNKIISFILILIVVVSVVILMLSGFLIVMAYRMFCSEDLYEGTEDESLLYFYDEAL